MGDFELTENFLEYLKEKLYNEDMALGFTSDISFLGEKYNLTLGEIGRVCNALEKILKGEEKEDELQEKLFQILGVREEEILEVCVYLKKILKQIKKAEDISKKLKMSKKELVKRKKK